jgi:hypothetical protein
MIWPLSAPTRTDATTGAEVACVQQMDPLSASTATTAFASHPITTVLPSGVKAGEDRVVPGRG